MSIPLVTLLGGRSALAYQLGANSVFRVPPVALGTAALTRLFASDSKKPSQDLAKKLKAKTPIGKLAELDEGSHPYQEKEPLKRHPGGVNPSTGEVGGPAGPEPTRYGDWERKGRVTDF